MGLVGRAKERGALDGLLSAARDDVSGASVVLGEPGIGKTSLLEFAANAAADFQVVRVDGFESERDLAFAGVHRLLVPFLPGRTDLPAAQRTALEAAFGLAEGDPPTRFLVGLGTLSLLATAASSSRPLLCLVDDAQWLDDESLAVLGFVARRLHADRIAIVFAARDPDGVRPLEGIPTLRVEGLLEAEAHELLSAVAGSPVNAAVAERVFDETRGSPIALIEIGRSLKAEPVLDHSWSAPLPLSNRLEAHFLCQVQQLPVETQSLLLIVAAEPSGNRAVIEAAADALSLPLHAADAAERNDVVVRDHAIRFRHPLVRSAVYGGATSAERRGAHQALAEASGQLGDVDRRAWHLGASASHVDEAVAGELQLAAERALRRGGCAASAAFFTRAAELSPTPRDRVDRALAAAERHLIAGFRIRARRVLADFADDIEDPLQQARASRLEGTIRYTLGEVDGTVALLLDAAKMLAPLDLHAARDTMLDALAASRIPGVYGTAGEREIDIAQIARDMALPPGQVPTIGDLLLDGHVALVLGDPSTARHRMSEAIAALEADPSDTDTMLRWLGIGCWAAGTLGDDEAVRRLASRLENSARAHGAIVPLALALLFLALNELGVGELTAARAHLLERDQLTEILGRPKDIGRLLTLAWEGDEAGARAEVAAVAAAAQERRHGWMIIFVDQAQAVLELGLGHYAAALGGAAASYRDNPFFATGDFPNLIEAATRGGSKDLAEDAVAEYVARTDSSDTPLARSLLARSRALIADDAAAEDYYREAIDLLADTRTVQLARAQLLFGEWLRRQKRRTDAREQLRVAAETFWAMGANAFAARADRELAATGERGRRRDYDTARDLTPQESQIGHLAASGATNQEIAAALFLSPNTVDYHLRKVYRKLEITSRRQLSGAMPP
jgi:DNA-binding CsgD family transcriptional regulator